MHAPPPLPLTPELLERYDRPGPRYTSYPTALEFSAEFDDSDYLRHLSAAGRDHHAPLSLYLHLPFCEERCTYCGCHVVITRNREIAAKYLEYLHREIDLLASALGDRRSLTQLHWGGGTPTYLAPDQIRSLNEHVRATFDLEPAAEIAIEIDPRVTTSEQLTLLHELGFNRISMGVQDATPEVQQAIGRRQTASQTRTTFARCRELGFDSINLDLIYGLPRQTPERFARTVDLVTELRPDRIALYSYAHVPWVKPNQKRIDVTALPTPRSKLDLFCRARSRLLEEGYEAIGMDHFALPDDELVLARQQRRLHRNFMGYTVRGAGDMVGCGISAIGDVAGAFVQNRKKLPAYYEAIDAGRFPIERGYSLDRDDRIRREVILQLMCNLRLDRALLEQRYDIEFDTYFAQELDELQGADGPIEHGFVELDAERLDVVGHGRLFVRNICMIFDRHLRGRGTAAPTYSQTV